MSRITLRLTCLLRKRNPTFAETESKRITLPRQSDPKNPPGPPMTLGNMREANTADIQRRVNPISLFWLLTLARIQSRFLPLSVSPATAGIPIAPSGARAAGLNLRKRRSFAKTPGACVPGRIGRS